LLAAEAAHSRQFALEFGNLAILLRTDVTQFGIRSLKAELHEELFGG